MKMLLIDDDAVSRAALIEISGPPLGWEVIEQEDGQQALELLLKGLKPELCIVDLLMPNMGGMEFLQNVRKDPYLQHLKVVVTSSKRDRETILGLAQLQVSGYLLKPYDAGKVKFTLQPLMVANRSVDYSTKKSSKHTLLAVDDDPVMREAIKALLASYTDWEVKFAVDGDDAFECLYAGLRPDLIITDLNMANADGVELLRRIRRDRNFSNVKVAVISAVSDRDGSAMLAGLDLYAFIRKPVSSTQLTSLLKRVTGP